MTSPCGCTGTLVIFVPLADNQFDTGLFCFVFYFGLQFIITPVAEHKFLFFCNAYFVFLIFKNKRARLLPDAEIDQFPAVQMKPMVYIPALQVFVFIQCLLFPLGSMSGTAKSNASLNPSLTCLNGKSSV